MPSILETALEDLMAISCRQSAEWDTLGVQQVDEELVRVYAEDLQALLEEAGLIERKAFLRLFVKPIEVDKGQVIVNYTLPLSTDGRITESVGLLLQCSVSPNAQNAKPNIRAEARETSVAIKQYLVKVLYFTKRIIHRYKLKWNRTH